MIPNACDRSESSILELGAKTKEIKSFDPCEATRDIRIQTEKKHGREIQKRRIEIKGIQNHPRPPGEVVSHVAERVDSEQIRKRAKVAPVGTSEETDERLDILQEPLKKRHRIEKIEKAGVSFLLTNIRSFRNKINAGKLTIELENSQPDVILLTETWLDASTEEIYIPGYRSIARRDRGTSKKGGGIDIFAKNECRDVGMLEISETSERSWATLHTSLGPILIGVWYRPPDEDAAELRTLALELERLTPGHIGTYIFCDANVHHKRWLKFSRENTRLGQELQDICDAAGLEQLVREPTRGKHLLDLVLTSMPDVSKVKTLGSISDHRAVLCETKAQTSEIINVPREVWNFRDADWDGLRQAFKEEDWSFLRRTSQDGADELTERILETARKFIPKRVINERKSGHPWITEECRSVVREKNEIETRLLQFIRDYPGHTSRLQELDEELQGAIRHCNVTLGRAYEAYVHKVREEIKILPKGSKKWWRLNRVLLGRSAKKTGSVPPLKNSSGQWVLESVDKANLLGKSFESKSVLPEKQNEWFPEESESSQSSFFLIRQTVTEQILKDINPDKATGPDMLPGRILKECAEVLALPITLLARQLLAMGCWPDCWRVHWITPLYKKGSPSNPGKYRGVHLTTVLSKTVERVISKTLGDYLEETGAMGETQWAFRAGHSCRDLVALVTATWILRLHAGVKIGVYISDISGAFDRVSSELLLRKLKAAGLHEDIMAFLESYLKTRTSNVIVEGCHSADFLLEDSIFQGTVLGPKLWNVFFQDVSVAPPPEYEESKFADDLTCYKSFTAETDNEAIYEDLKKCQSAVHGWGASNQAIFDESKEEFCIIHGNDGEGDDFRFLGTWMDTALRMESNISKIMSKARPKVQAILRCHRFYSTEELVMQYKSHVLCHLEINTGGFYHALDSVLDTLERLQTSSLNNIVLTREGVFQAYNLAPLSTRRDIAML